MFNIIEKRKIFFIISAIIIVAGIVSFFVQGFKTDIDFAGGTALTITTNAKYNENEIRKTVESVEGIKVSSVQKASSASMKGAIVMVEDDLDDVQTKAVKAAITAKYEDAKVDAETISPKIGKELWQSAIASIVAVALLMLIYITFRFDGKLSIEISVTHSLNNFQH